MPQVYSGNFSEARITSLCGSFPDDKDQFNESYDYESDSDLGDDSDELELNSDPEQGDTSSTSVADQQASDTLEQLPHYTNLGAVNRLYPQQMLPHLQVSKILTHHQWESKLGVS